VIKLKLIGQEIELPADKYSTPLVVGIVGVTLALALHIALVQAKAENIREFKTSDEKDTPTMVAPLEAE